MYYFLEIDYTRYIHVYFKRRKKYIGIIMKTNLFRVDCVAVLNAWIWNMLFLLRKCEICFSYCVNMKYAFLIAWIWNVLFLLREYKLYLRNGNLETCCVNIFCVPSYHFIATYIQYLPIPSLTLIYLLPHHKQSVMPYAKYLSYP
jgi:hypothetical protein